ncbi:putative 3-oxo-5-alpha-steroid 4-dehydrogenase [Helianthus debilis subsp. tardiflorus]
MDTAVVTICLTSIVIVYITDTRFHTFVSRNERLKQFGKPLVPNIDAGLSYYSRHPNYFGEQLWWWGLVVFAWNLVRSWVFIGALTNNLCLAYVTILVERKMVKLEYRSE